MSDAPIDRLRRISAALEAGMPLRPDDAAWLARGLQRYLRAAPKGVTLDRAVMPTASGATPWWEREPREYRDELIRQIRICGFISLSTAQAAEKIWQLASQYRASRGRVLPSSSLARTLFDKALATGLPFPRPRQLHTILSKDKPALIARKTRDNKPMTTDDIDHQLRDAIRSLLARRCRAPIDEPVYGALLGLLVNATEMLTRFDRHHAAGLAFDERQAEAYQELAGIRSRLMDALKMTSDPFVSADA